MQIKKLTAALAVLALTLSSTVGVIAQDDAAAEAAPDAQDVQAPNTMMEKASFMLGFEFMMRFQSQNIEVDLEQLMAGIEAAKSGKDPGMDKEEIQAVMRAFQQEIRTKMAERRERVGMENRTKGEEFLKNFAGMEGVGKLDNGVLYQVLTPGTGDQPKATDTVKVHYRGTLVSGDEFDSSIGGDPAQFAVGGVIQGFSSALQAMKVGSKWKVAIPSDLAYGPNGSRSIGPNETLIFEIELIDIVK